MEGEMLEDGKLTFATAMNVQDIIVYAFTREGVYRYEPADHSLIRRRFA